MTILSTSNTIYIAKPDYLKELCAELTETSQVIENLVFSPRKKSDVCFALDVWPSYKIEKFESINQAATLLRQQGKYWYLNPIAHVRRSRLIESKLRKLPSLILPFPIIDALPSINCFSLLDNNTLLYSLQRWKKPPMGNYQFLEDKHNPPNRAYLKLWEALSTLDHYPKPGELVLDLGASPGGWSSVMHGFGADVIAVDKAPLDERIAKLPRIDFRQQSAFSLEPADFTVIDWLIADIACYPDRLYTLVTKWLASGKVKRMICTIKLQGGTDLDAIKKFQDIPSGRVLHLNYNKHEATFFYPAEPQLFPFE